MLLHAVSGVPLICMSEPEQFCVKNGIALSYGFPKHLKCQSHAVQVWISPDGGYADEYVKAVRQWSDSNTELTVVAMLLIFAIFHSGLAFLRPFGALLNSASASTPPMSRMLSKLFPEVMWTPSDHASHVGLQLVAYLHAC